VDGLWAAKSEGVGLIVRVISFQDFQPMLQADRQTDGRTTCNRNTSHRAVKRQRTRNNILWHLLLTVPIIY